MKELAVFRSILYTLAHDGVQVIIELKTLPICNLSFLPLADFLEVIQRSDIFTSDKYNEK